MTVERLELLIWPQAATHRFHIPHLDGVVTVAARQQLRPGVFVQRHGRYAADVGALLREQNFVRHGHSDLSWSGLRSACFWLADIWLDDHFCRFLLHVGFSLLLEQVYARSKELIIRALRLVSFLVLGFDVKPVCSCGIIGVL